MLIFTVGSSFFFPSLFTLWRAFTPQCDPSKPDPLQSALSTSLCSHSNLAAQTGSNGDGSLAQPSCPMVARFAAAALLRVLAGSAGSCTTLGLGPTRTGPFGARTTAGGGVAGGRAAGSAAAAIRLVGALIKHRSVNLIFLLRDLIISSKLCYVV